MRLKDERSESDVEICWLLYIDYGIDIDLRRIADRGMADHALWSGVVGFNVCVYYPAFNGRKYWNGSAESFSMMPTGNRYCNGNSCYRRDRCRKYSESIHRRLMADTIDA